MVSPPFPANEIIDHQKAYNLLNAMITTPAACKCWIFLTFSYRKNLTGQALLNVCK